MNLNLHARRLGYDVGFQHICLQDSVGKREHLYYP